MKVCFVDQCVDNGLTPLLTPAHQSFGPFREQYADLCHVHFNTSSVRRPSTPTKHQVESVKAVHVALHLQ